MIENTPIDFSYAKVLVIGDVMLDQYWHGESSRISPEAPVPVVHSQYKEMKIGGAANVAANVKSLGADVFLLGAVGEDEHASTLRTLLDEQEIPHFFSTHPKHTTICKTRIMANGQQVVRVDEEAPLSAKHIESLYQYYQTIVPNYDVIILSDYLKGTLYNPQILISLANQANKIVLVDPKGVDYSIYQNAFCITPNYKEFKALSQADIHTEEDVAKHMQRLATSLNLQALLLTRGAKGMSLWQQSPDASTTPIINIPTQAKSVYDVSGAGDTVIATLACGLARLVNKQYHNTQEQSHILQESVHYANQAAGIAVTQAGSYAVSIEELNRLFAKQTRKYIQNPAQLGKIIKKLKTAKQRIVFTNGCFDILHSGHIHCLEEATKLGDQLIIAINCDDSVKRLKGNARPINTLMDRVEVISALSAVDWVIAFGDHLADNDTPINLIKAIQPDVLVKGSDYNDSTIVGADYVKSYGGTVQTITLKKGYSSTKLIDQFHH